MIASVSVIMTCFNRKNKTSICLNSLKRQIGMPYFDLYVCDDGSTDGTSEVVRSIYPKAKIIKGTGKLFWSKGMHVAMEAAVKHGYDYYLMINDDVEFFETMWQTMFKPFADGKNTIAVAGCTTSKENEKQITYGGQLMVKTLFNYYMGPKIKLCKEKNLECDVANWNCFLIDAYVQRKIGLIDNTYEHALGDYDYCLLMRKSKMKILITTDFIGYCEVNAKRGTYLDKSLPRKVRIQKMNAANGFPFRSWFYFVNKHYGKYKFRSAISPYLKNYYAIIMGKDII